MFKIINKNEIHLTRGNVAFINVKSKVRKKSSESDEEIKVQYEFKVGDVVRLNIVKKGDYSQVVLTKDVIVTEPTEKVTIFLSGEETKIGELINKQTIYWYEVELNPDTHPQTIIGHDKETGPKLFVLYPEGGKN